MQKNADPIGVLAFPHRLTRGEKAVGLYNEVGPPHDDPVALYTLIHYRSYFHKWPWVLQQDCSTS